MQEKDSQTEQEVRLIKKLRDLMNSAIPKMDSDFFRKTGKDKTNTRISNVYYAGGTLCVDVVSGDEIGLIMLNISDETITIIVGEKTTKNLMNIQTLWFAFLIYKEAKGDHRDYYKDCYNKSCIRHLYDSSMNRRMYVNPDIEDFVVEGYSRSAV